jgi:moderate conductance mechanosensitive channel
VTLSPGPAGAATPRGADTLPSTLPSTLPETVPATLADLDRTWSLLLFGPPGKTVAIIVLALLARVVIHRLVTRVAETVASGRAGLGRLDQHLATASAVLSVTPPQSARREQRARTMASVLRGITTVAVIAVATLMILPLYGFSVAALLTSAGILGVAFGFGAQTLVKDFLSGMFMIAEDQYGVGDVVDLGRASGVVEAVGLRVTRLRALDGTVWYVRNGEVQRVGNRSQGWARAVLDIGVDVREDIGRVEDLLREVATELHTDPRFASAVLEDPEVWGVEAISAEAVVLRLVVKTAPLQQWTVARELRRRIKDRFDADGVRAAPATGAARDGSGASEDGPGESPEPEDLEDPGENGN